MVIVFTVFPVRHAANIFGELAHERGFRVPAPPGVRLGARMRPESRLLYEYRASASRCAGCTFTSAATGYKRPVSMTS